jgi:ParB-like chromosome segregation protein Spo0J
VPVLTLAPGERTGELVSLVPVERLRTSFATLRCPIAGSRPDDLVDLPLRAAEVEDGFFEVVDGFKRFERWRAEGRTEIPVVVERSRSTEELMALLLAANAPRRTVTVMDEARVVEALLKRPGVGRATAARLLGRRPWWVENRLALALKLAASVQRRLDVGALRPTIATALTKVAGKDQERLVRAIETNGLTTREAIALVLAFARLEDEKDRAELLRDPIARLRRPRPTSPLSPVAEAAAARLEQARSVLKDLARGPVLPEGLTDAERQRLEAGWRRVLDQLRETTAALGVEEPGVSLERREEKAHGEEEAETEGAPPVVASADRGGQEGDPPPRGGSEAVAAGDRGSARPRPEADPQLPRGGAAEGAVPGAGRVPIAIPARAVRGRDRGEGRERAHYDADPPRDP